MEKKADPVPVAVPKSLLLSLFLVAGTSAGCKEFATPAELSRTQILAIATEPPAVLPGARSALTILVADEEGEVEAPVVAWESVAPLPDSVPIGVVETDGDGNTHYVAPSEQPEDNPALAMVQAVVPGDEGGDPLVALKAVIVGRVPLANPALAAFSSGTVDLLTDPQLALALDEAATLSVETLPAATEDSMYHWYSTIGTIESYRSNPTELVADESGQGWLFAVVRDGYGGVVWHKVSVTVE